MTPKTSRVASIMFTLERTTMSANSRLVSLYVVRIACGGLAGGAGRSRLWRVGNALQQLFQAEHIRGHALLVRIHMPSSSALCSPDPEHGRGEPHDFRWLVSSLCVCVWCVCVCVCQLHEDQHCFASSRRGSRAYKHDRRFGVERGSGLLRVLEHAQRLLVPRPVVTHPPLHALHRFYTRAHHSH